MADLSITKLYTLGGASDESQIDQIETDIETFFNTTKVNSDNIQPLSLTAAKITAANITRAKRAATNISLSSDLTSSQTSGTTDTQVGGSGATTVNLTTVGRPVVVSLLSTGDTGSFNGKVTMQSGVSGGYTSGYMALFNNGSEVARWELSQSNTAVASRSILTAFAPGAFWFLHVPASGVQSYEWYFSVDASSSSGSFISVTEIKSMAYEL